MRETYDLIEIAPEELTAKALDEKKKGAHLVQISSVRIEKGFELSYSFADKENHMVNYRIVIDEDYEMLSISDIFPPAFLYENEIAELFGVKINHINLDYGNKLYRIDVEAPFKN